MTTTCQYVTRAFVCLYCLRYFLSSSWCREPGRGLAVAYDCGTPWTFHLTF